MLSSLKIYWKSSVFRSIVFIKQSSRRSSLSSLPVKDYYPILSKYLAYTFHMTNVFRNTDSVISSSASNPEDHFRICTLGVVMWIKKKKSCFSIRRSRVKIIIMASLKTGWKMTTHCSARFESTWKELDGAAASYSVHETSSALTLGMLSLTSNVQAFPDIYESIKKVKKLLTWFGDCVIFCTINQEKEK